MVPLQLTKEEDVPKNHSDKMSYSTVDDFIHFLEDCGAMINSSYALTHGECGDPKYQSACDNTVDMLNYLLSNITHRQEEPERIMKISEDILTGIFPQGSRMRLMVLKRFEWSYPAIWLPFEEFPICSLTITVNFLPFSHQLCIIHTPQSYYIVQSFLGQHYPYYLEVSEENTRKYLKLILRMLDTGDRFLYQELFQVDVSRYFNYPHPPESRLHCEFSKLEVGYWDRLKELLTAGLRLAQDPVLKEDIA